MRKPQTAELAWQLLDHHGWANVSLLDGSQIQTLRNLAKAHGRKVRIPNAVPGVARVATFVEEPKKGWWPRKTQRYVGPRYDDGQTHEVTVRHIEPRGPLSQAEQRHRIMLATVA